MPDIPGIVQFDGMSESLFDQLLKPGNNGRGRAAVRVGSVLSERGQGGLSERLRVAPGEHGAGGGTAVLEMPGEGVNQLVTSGPEEFRIIERPNAVERGGGRVEGVVHSIECRAGWRAVQFGARCEFLAILGPR